MKTLYDMHCHLGFSPNPRQLAGELGELGVRSLVSTVTPSSFSRAAEVLRGVGCTRTGLGLHPWWVAGQSLYGELRAFDEGMCAAAFVGEAGLDFGQRHVGEREAQLAAFGHVARTCAKRGGLVLSIHVSGPGAASSALDSLAEAGCLETCTCIFHWFHGNGDEFARAVRAGCLLSVGERMLETRRGREYARQAPLGRLLLETDLPAREGDMRSASELKLSLENALEHLVDLRPEPQQTVRSSIENASERVWEMCQWGQTPLAHSQNSLPNV